MAIDRILTSRTVDEAIKQAEQQGGNGDAVNQVEQSEIAIYNLFNACPELGPTIVEALSLEKAMPD